VTNDIQKNKLELHLSYIESFKVTLADTGLQTNTAGRIKEFKNIWVMEPI
jgi:glucose-1-phosphate cytidylyltransferase